MSKFPFDGEKFGKDVVAAVKAYVEREVAPLVARIEALESGGVKFCGVYQRACAYQRGDAVTSGGAAWVAIKDAPPGVKPGDDAGAAYWQLWQKSPAG